MKIITADITHIEELSILFDGYRIFYGREPDTEGAKKFLADRIKNNESVIYAVEENGNLLGFTQLYPIFSSTRMGRMWMLNDLFVANEHRGKGISKLLIERAKQLAVDTNAVALILETAKDNIEANALYKSTGWEIDDEHNFYYWINE